MAGFEAGKQSLEIVEYTLYNCGACGMPIEPENGKNLIGPHPYGGTEIYRCVLG